MWPVHTFAAAPAGTAHIGRTSHDARLPDYDELPEVPGLGIRHAWDVFGRDDVLGSINLVTPERVARAAASVTTGRDDPARPPARRARPAAVRPPAVRAPRRSPSTATRWTTTSTTSTRRAPRSGTPSSHVRCREHGFWGGRTQDPTDGPERARHRPLGPPRHRRARRADRRRRLRRRRPTTATTRWRRCAVTADDLRAALATQGVEPEVGDIWCVRTGWYQALPAARRRGASRLRRRSRTSPACAPTRRWPGCVWNAHPAALCCDNPAVEVVPGRSGGRLAAPPPAADARHRARRDVRPRELAARLPGRRPLRRSSSSPRRSTSRTASGSPGNAVAIR